MLGIHDVIVVGIISLFGAVGVAIISGVISIVGLVIAKEQKLSDFRQAWVDALRDDISHFVSHPIMISAYKKLVLEPKLQALDEKKAESPQELKSINREEELLISSFYSEMKEDYSKINVYSTRIKLRLNDDPRETDSRALLAVLARMEKLFSNIRTLDDQAVHDAVLEIEGISRPLLKKEWERVKEGEKTFKISKYAALAVVSLIAVAVLGLFLSVPAYLAGYSTSQESPQHMSGRHSWGRSER